jgi:hypothetical protein
MNPLSSLPASTSPQFSLNKLDWQKIGRMALVQVAGLLASLLPMAAGFSYKFGGVDYTPFVVMIVNLLAEGLRRWSTGS